MSLAPRDGVEFCASESVAVTASKTVVTGNELRRQKKNGRTQSADRGQSVKSHCLMMTVRLMGLLFLVTSFVWTMVVKSTVQ